MFPILTGVVIHMIQCIYITGDLDDDQNGYQLCSAINACPWDLLCVKNYLISAFKICIDLHSLPINSIVRGACSSPELKCKLSLSQITYILHLDGPIKQNTN